MTPRRFGPLEPIAPACLAAAVLVACASPPNPALQQAQANYQAAAQDPAVLQAASPELQKAKDLLDSAAAEDEAETTHRAYLASQQVAIARETATLNQTEQAIQTAGTQRSQTVLAARTSEAQAERARARQLEQELADLKAKQTPRGLVLTLGNVLFKTGQAELAPGAQTSIDRLASYLQTNPAQAVKVEGYTDSTGSDATNLSLSQRRADAVRMALVARGVDPARIDARGYGETSPVADNSTTEGRQMNRRVEVVVANTGASPAQSGSSGAAPIVGGGVRQ